ncbi:MAG: right-handed parallel beta-helix repeat-containing protein [Burkholderiales bacterium]|nr:right-handed parallel beta-helix repeat-containing protein [Burkholderiales bacterium]
MKKLLGALAFLALLFASRTEAANLLVEPASTSASLAQALESAQDGDVIDIMPGEYKAEPLLLPPKRLTLRGVGPRPVLRADGKPGAARGIWVVDGGDITIENLEFRGARSLDADGAGIFVVSGHVHVVNCAFHDDEHGIQTGNDANTELKIDNSVFGDAPRIVGGLAHLLNVGRIARLEVRGSRFQNGFEGHLIKSRARETRLLYNLIDDGPTGQASYEVDLPDAGQAWLIGNVIGQSPQSRNPVVVAYGAESRNWDKNALYLAHNTLISRGWIPAWFLRVFRDHLPAATPVVAVNNLVIGPGVFSWGARGDFEGNSHSWSSSLVDLDTMALEIAPDSRLRGSGIDPSRIDGQDLSPKAEFTPPVGTRPLGALSHWSPGAYPR